MGLYRKNGTRLTKAALPIALLDDPLVTVTADIYQSEPYGRGDGQPEGSKRFLLYPAGSMARRSVVEALFTAATITSVSPAKGPQAGGTVVTITGTALDGASTVTFGGKPGTNLRVQSATQLTVTTPSGTAGSAAVAITHDTGTTSLPDAFAYEA
ncbi:IPT/TIG domain-containing protein [Streptomyces sp. bgisy060]|uniref:IPT/TIG domain-containing protein n=1 Tax=Streptomyces sp. bgisy060 TaxID=3413775 RepID=UPI003EC13AC9